MYGKIFVGFDLETGSAFDDEGRKIITELGAVKYVYTNTGFKPVAVFSELVNEGQGVHADAIEYTGITPKLIEDFGGDLRSVLNEFSKFIISADYLVSHNGDNFDIPVMNDAYDEVNMKACKSDFNKITNIDTMTCVSYPNNCKSRNLTYLQAFYGFVNPFPHRAYADVMAMMKILGNFNIEEVCAVAISPAVKYMAVFDYPQERKYPSKSAFASAMKDFNTKKDIVKSLGFLWHPENKKWIYEGKELIFKRDIQTKLTCPVHKLGE